MVFKHLSGVIKCVCTRVHLQAYNLPTNMFQHVKVKWHTFNLYLTLPNAHTRTHTHLCKNQCDYPGLLPSNIELIKDNFIMVSPPAVGQLHRGNKSKGNKIMSYLKGANEDMHVHPV